MIIVLEGPDGVGKSSIAKRMAEKYDMELLRCPGSSELGEQLRPLLKRGEFDPMVRTLLFQAVDLQAVYMAEQLDEAEKDVVMDRCGLSGLIYRIGAMEFDEARVLLSAARAYRRLLWPHHAHVVRLDASDETLDDRMGRRPDDVDSYNCAAHRIRQAYRSLDLRCVLTDQSSIDQVASTIYNWNHIAPLHDHILNACQVQMEREARSVR